MHPLLLDELAAARVDDLRRQASRERRALPLTLALWRVADPGNVGTLVRTADAFGAAVALSRGCAARVAAPEPI